MNTHRFPGRLPGLRPAVLLTASVLSFAALSAAGAPPGAAQSEQAERQLENKIPKHLPIRVKVKNLNSARWERDLEVEIKNVSDKPIYYMRFGIAMPDVISGGHPMGFSLQYGRTQLIFFTEPLQPDDAPLLPGETYTFKLREQEVQGWESFVRRNNLPKGEPKKIRLILGEINFGDGTGFRTTGGLPVDIHKKQSRNDCGPTGPQRAALDAAEQPPGLVPGSLQRTIFFLPAGLLPVNFSAKKTAALPPAPAPRRDPCCPGPVLHAAAGKLQQVRAPAGVFLDALAGRDYAPRSPR